MIAVILNPSATTHASPELVGALLRKYEIDAQVVTAARGENITALAKRLLDEGYHTLVAAGGDGTVSSVAAALIDTDARLGVLPLGGLNHFARDMRIPGALEESVRTLKTGSEKSVDVAEVNGHTFLNNSGLGLYPLLVAARERRRRLGWPKWIAFFHAALATLRRFPFVSVRVIARGQELRRRTPFVFVGNNVYRMEGIGLGSRESLTDGALFLGVARRPIGRWGLAALAVRALVGRIHDALNVDFLEAREMEVLSRRKRLHVSLDGEVMRLRTPLHYRIRPGALKVIAP